MLKILKKITIIDEIQSLTDSQNSIQLRVSGHRARIESYRFILVSALFIIEHEIVTDHTLRYLTLLLAAHPDTHDHALQLTDEGLWLWCQYDKHDSAEILTIGMEKQVSLLRYLHSVITHQNQKNNLRG